MDQNLERFIADLTLEFDGFEEDFYSECVLKELGTRITELRLETGFSCAEFAEKVGMKPGHFSRLVGGHHNPSILFLEKMAQKVGAHVEISFISEDK